MFTGLVEIQGAVTSVRETDNGIRLSLKPIPEFELRLGDSVSVNGVCLTVTKHNKEISFDVSPETMRSTNLGELKNSDSVNLERALRLSDRLGGHIVSGHVDNVGSIREIKKAGEYTFYRFDATNDILKYVVKKGSIAIDGISLTVVDLDSSSFSVAIIPHTLSATNIGKKKVGDRVNLEVDIIGKYIEKLLNTNDTGSNLMGLLREKGFVND
ncbi:MAG: riboflavin synthase [Nitrospiraceae bacterium]|nr:MAG: riboflavin synthase [Nitrospiraceae bacterium]